VCFSRKSKCSNDLVSCVQVVDSYDQSICICRCYREKDGKRHAYWALVEGYRIARPAATGGGLTVCAMEERGSLGVKRCAAAQDGEQANLFVGPGEPEPVEFDGKGVRVGRTRRFGDPR
jgi:hypothetical protein